MRLIVCSEAEIASRNMWNMFLENFGFKKTGKTYSGFPIYRNGNLLLAKSKEKIIFINDLDEHFDPECYVFASPHSSETGRPCLSVHSPGNFYENRYGGNRKELSIAPSSLIKSALLNLEKNNLTDFPVTLEVTHHGPTGLKKPVLFVEVGSKEEEWNNQKAIETVCRAIMDLKEEKGTSAIGFGGPHYAPNFTKRELESELMFGHICPKYHASRLDCGMVEQMLEKTSPKPERAIIDWKGLRSNHREMVVDCLEKKGIKWEKI